MLVDVLTFVVINLAKQTRQKHVICIFIKSSESATKTISDVRTLCVFRNKITDYELPRR